MKKDFLAALGMNQKESGVFLKMLELGSQPVSVIAKHVHAPRSSVYAILERLRQLGVIEEFSHHGIRYVHCVPADVLGEILEDRQHAYAVALEDFEKRLPSLRLLENRLSITPRVKFYEGKKAVKKMYENVLKEKDFYAFFNPESVKQKMPEYLHKIPKTLRENGGRAKEVLVDNALAREYLKQYDSDKHQIRLFPEKRVFEADWIVGKITIYLVSYGESDISGTEIESPSLVQSQRAVFEALWSRI